jgi:hypothetical protein
MGASATKRTDGERAQHNVTEQALGELQVSDIQVMNTARVGELTREALLAVTASPALECDSEDSNTDVAESLIPCSTLRAGPSRGRIVVKGRCAHERGRRCAAGKHFTCRSSRLG